MNAPSADRCAPRSAARRPSSPRAAALALAVMLAAGCAGTAPPGPASPVGTPRPRVALLPLENLTGKAEAASLLHRMLFVELVRSGCCEVVESGIVDSALGALRIRDTGSLTSSQMHGLGEVLDVPYLMIGTALESGVARTPEGEVPSAGAALKLLEVSSGKVLWAEMRFRTGDDRETVFGWGRETNAQKLAGALAADVLEGFRIPAAPQPREGGGER